MTQAERDELIVSMARTAARHLRDCLADWAYPSTRAEQLDSWRSALRRVIGADVPSDYVEFLTFCEGLALERAA